MNSPSFFLADLPREATLTPDIIIEAGHTLVRNRQKYLVPRDTQAILRTLATLAESWLDPNDPFRQRTLSEGPDATGFSRQTISAGLDGFFSQLTLPNLQNWIVQEFGHARRPDQFCAIEEESESDRTASVSGPALIFHVCAGNLPNPTLLSMVSGLILRSAQFVKCGTGASFIPRMFAHSLHALEPKLASCLEVAEWKGGSAHLEEAAYQVADCVTATGSEKTLSHIRRSVPANKKLVCYGTRLSFGYVTAESLHGPHPQKVAAHAAQDIIAWDQQGCLSPHVIYVESGGSMAPETFAEILADQLEAYESVHPRGRLSHEESATITTRRSVYELRSAQSAETKMWKSQGSTAWTVVFEAEPQFQVSCLNRFVYVKPSIGLDNTLHLLDSIHGQVSTVGIAAPRHQLAELAHKLAVWGVTRVCPLGKMQRPALAWRHDGRPALADLVTWCDLES
jgi:hypothetical protein